MPKVERGPISTCPRFYACPRYLQVWRRFNQKWSRYRPDNIFPIICLWDLLVATETGSDKICPQNLIQPVPHPNDGTCEIWSRLADWPWRYSCSKWGRTDDGALLYYKLTLWTVGSGVLKIILGYPKCGQWRFWSDSANAQNERPESSSGTRLKVRFLTLQLKFLPDNI